MDDDDIFENQVDFIAERNVWERVGGGGDIGLGGVIDLKKSGYTIDEKFKLIAVATIQIINDSEEILNNHQIAHMLRLVEKVPDFEYKNPSAFVMGYMVAINSNYQTLEIDKNMLETILKINVDIEDKLFHKIENTDIIRYTRLCLLHKIK